MNAVPKAEIASTFYPDDINDEGPTVDDSILLIYTGGTIGATPKDPNDPNSPLDIAKWDVFKQGVPQFSHFRSKGLRIDAVALDNPLDSANLEPCHWQKFVNIIEENYYSYMGFVLLHGTDTMVYTASALSFMLDGLSKPVILTGSQLPILYNMRSDGVMNLINAIMIAGYKKFELPRVGEVCIVFDKVLLRGNRSRKLNANKLAGFESPNCLPLGTLDDDIVINESVIRSLGKTDPIFNAQTELSTAVISLQIFPGIQDSDVLSQCLKIDNLQGIVLQTYGTGNAPTTPAFLAGIAEAVNNNKLIVDVTQCFRGSVELGQYETGIGLLKAGVLTGLDITPEAALCKMMVLLSRFGGRKDDAKAQMQRSIVGEQSESLFSYTFAVDEIDAASRLTRENNRLTIHSTTAESWGTAPIKSAWLHLPGGIIIASEGDTFVEFEIYFNLGSNQKSDQRHPGFAGRTRKEVPTDQPNFISFDLTAREGAEGLKLHRQGEPIRVTLVLTRGESVSFERASLLLFVRDGTVVAS